MKKEELVVLNGIEYTATLNRESFIRIDKLCNIQETFSLMEEEEKTYIDEIDDNYNPFEEEIDFDKMDKDELEKEKKLHNMIERGFFIWLYPVHKINISQIKEILKPYFENEEKAKEIAELFANLLKASIEIKNDYEQERKNLLAQINK